MSPNVLTVPSCNQKLKFLMTEKKIQYKKKKKDKTCDKKKKKKTRYLSSCLNGKYYNSHRDSWEPKSLRQKLSKLPSLCPSLVWVHFNFTNSPEEKKGTHSIQLFHLFLQLSNDLVLLFHNLLQFTVLLFFFLQLLKRKTIICSK